MAKRQGILEEAVGPSKDLPAHRRSIGWKWKMVGSFVCFGVVFPDSLFLFAKSVCLEKLGVL